MKPPDSVGKKNETDGTRLRRGRQFQFFSRPNLDGFIILASFFHKTKASFTFEQKKSRFLCKTARFGREKNETDSTRLRRGRQFHFFPTESGRFHNFSPIKSWNHSQFHFWAKKTETKHSQFHAVSRETDHKKKSRFPPKTAHVIHMSCINHELPWSVWIVMRAISRLIILLNVPLSRYLKKYPDNVA